MSKIFSQIFKNLRKKHGLYQTDLAEELKVSQSTIYKWENGTEPNIETLKKIADFFNVNIEYLLGTSNTGDINVRDINGNNNTLNTGTINSNLQLSNEEKELLSLWNNTSKEKQQAIINLLKN